MTNHIIPLLITICSLPLFAGADWLRFRGPNGSGVADNEHIPISWSIEGNKNIAWRVELPGRGSSSPIVIGNRLVVTCASGYHQDRLHVICFDTASGRQIWARQLWATGRTMTHSSISPAAPTAVSDGKRICAHFSTNDLACFDLAGNLLWLRGLMIEFPNASNSLGLASSLIMVDETLVVKIENDSQSLALGIDPASGQTQWQVNRPALACWNSPVVMYSDDAPTALLLQSGLGMTAYNLRSGRKMWHYDHGCATIPSTVVAGNVAYVPSDGLAALSPTEANEPAVLWQNNQLGPSTPTPLIYQGRIYVVGGSILRCADAETGELKWRIRLKGARYTGSPVAAGGHIYVVSEEGQGQVVVADPEQGRIVGGGDLGETILCTPAIAGGGLYIRSDHHLWKIAAQK